MSELDFKEEEAKARANKDWGRLVELKIKQAVPRGAKRRDWVKLDSGWLSSSINYRMTPDERYTFSCLIVMAGSAKGYGRVPGLISDNDCREMPHEFLAQEAHVSLELFEETLKKGEADESIYQNGHGIFLINFDEYQFTEYDRQKQYREAKKQRDEFLGTDRSHLRRR